MSDRRASKRFEVLGRLRGSLAAERRVRVVNISPMGALIEIPEAWAIGSTHTMRISDAGVRSVSTGVRVCHVRPVAAGQGFLVGVQFLGEESRMPEDLSHMLAPEGLEGRVAHDVEPL